MSFFFIYVILLPAICLYVGKTGKAARKQYIPFLIVLLLSTFRYDTTSDYHNYVRMFWENSAGNLTDKQMLEFGYVYLNRLFGFTDWGFIGVLAVASLITYFSFYIFLKKTDLLCVGTYVFISLSCFTNCDNIVRQSIAMAFLNYSIYFYFSNRKILALFCIITAPIFHVSAYVLFTFLPLFYLLSKKILPKWIMILITILFLILYYLEVFEFIKEQIFSISFIINSVYGDYDDVEFSKDLIGVAFIIKTILCVLPVTIINKDTDKFSLLCINTSWFSIILRIAFSGIPFFFRIADYLTIFNIIAISMCISHYYKKMNCKLMAFSMCFLLYVLLFNHVSKYYGFWNPYYTIASDNCLEHKFYVRQTFDDVQTNGINTERDDYYILQN